MLEILSLSLWFLLPAAIANATPIFAARIPFLSAWSTPIDGGRQWRGKRLLGDNKTWRGLISGMAVATLVLYLQQLAVANLSWAEAAAGPVDYANLPVLLLGPLFGLGALGGDAIESFFKRRLGIKPGRSWIPFDQIDYILGGIVVSLPFVVLPFEAYLAMLIVWFVAHLIASFTGWLLGLKERPI